MRFVRLALVISCTSWSGAIAAQWPEPAESTLRAEQALARLQDEHPGVRIQRQASRISRVFGRPVSFGSSPEESAEQFLANYADALGVPAEELAPAGTLRSDTYVQPVMYDRATGTYKFTLVKYTQHRDGIPVFRADLRLLVRNTPDHPLTLAASSLRSLDGFALRADPMSLDFELAERSAAAAVPDLVDFTQPEPVIWAGVGDEVSTPVLALTFVADTGSPEGGDYQKWRFVVDASTGDILYQENLIIFTDVSGSVSGLATEIPKAEQCLSEVATPMPHATVSIQGGGSAYADASGNFTIPNGGTSQVTVQSPMSGHYFTVDNVAGAEETLTQAVTPPGPASFLHNAPNTTEAVRAQVNAYVQANVVRDFVLTYNPSYPVVAGQTNFTIRVNRTDLYCPGNAWYDGSSLNFCTSSGSYPNTAFSNVVHHEYGHHLVESAGSGQGQYGEGIGDCIGMLIADDPILGYGFQGNCSAGIRTGDNTMQFPCNGDIHDCAQLLSGCVWSTRNELAATQPSDYLDILSNLTVNSILLHSGESITPTITTDFLTLDDDDADLGNGTPHFDEITAGFGAHNMWAGPPPENDACGDAVLACPGTYAGDTSSMTNDGAASCGGSGAPPDVWYRYRPATNGTLSLELCDSSYDTVVSVHTGCPGTTGNEVGCNDDSGWFSPCSWLPTSQSVLSVAVTAGNTYSIRVSGFNGATGAYVMDVSGPACIPDCVVPADCNDGVGCTADDCVSGSCTHAPNDTACDDSLYCNGAETCNVDADCQPGGYRCAGDEWCDEMNDRCVEHGNGDFDPGDADVDVADFAAFQVCFEKSAMEASCEPANLTGTDETIDLEDFARFMERFGGPA